MTADPQSRKRDRESSQSAAFSCGDLAPKSLDCLSLRQKNGRSRERGKESCDFFNHVGITNCGNNLVHL
jgi:hypothetical protein